MSLGFFFLIIFCLFVCLVGWFFVGFFFFNKFEGTGHDSLTVSSGKIRTSLIQVFQGRNPLSNDLKQNNAKNKNNNLQ